MSDAALQAQLRAVLPPLRFAARNNFAQLERVHDLIGTLRQGLVRLQAACDAPHAKRWAASLELQLPDAEAPREARVAALTQLLRALEAGAPQAGPDTSDPVASRVAPPPAPPAAPQPAIAPRAPSSAGLTPRKPGPGVRAQSLPPALTTPLSALRGVGPRVAEQLASRDLHTVSDLLHFLPRRYQGRHGYQALGELTAGMVASVEGQISAINDRFVRGRRSLEVVIVDPTGTLHLVWFRVPGRAFVKQFRRGNRLRAAGSIKRFRAACQMVHPEVVHVADSGMEAPVHVGDAADEAAGDDVIALYLDVEGLHARALRRIVAMVLPAAQQMEDPLPQKIRIARNLEPLGEALAHLHRPSPNTAIEDLQEGRTSWHRRLIYDELLYLQLGLLQRRQQAHEACSGPRVAIPQGIGALAEELLPFAPTGAQARVMNDIAQDVAGPRPMHRLLQGDVGSGKTAVALTAALAMHRAGLQTAIMAPTELLAEQHARTATALMAPLGLQVQLLTGQLAPKVKRAALTALRDHTAHVVVGTHALIQADIAFAGLGLAVIDEQHRFGVLQRARLTELGRASTGLSPHMLVMTATPIPRTLALTVYGDLDVSIIDELPPGRTPIVTELHQDGARPAAYAQVTAAVARGEQAYVVFPLVEDSDKEGMSEIRAATSSAEELSQGLLRDLRLGLLHGRLTAEEKEAVMRAFARGDMDVLVATTVIEVGIDVPNATVMVIEHAERFGLSQLHQLRGRVGRGQGASRCVLLARARPSEDAWRRLDIMVQTQDGFRIAEEDLAIRGPGDFVGTRQSGLPILSMANLARDGAILVEAREDARALLAQDPTLAAYPALQAALATMWAGKMRLVQVG